MAGQQTLDLLIGVRIPAPQPVPPARRAAADILLIGPEVGRIETIARVGGRFRPSQPSASLASRR